jgi:hypothetical protein
MVLRRQAKLAPLKAIGLASLQRSTALPQVPTIAHRIATETVQWSGVVRERHLQVD